MSNDEKFHMSYFSLIQRVTVGPLTVTQYCSYNYLLIDYEKHGTSNINVLRVKLKTQRLYLGMQFINY